MKYDIKKAVVNFHIEGQLVEVCPYGSGHINDTYASKFKTTSGTQRFIHQRINHNIFKKPAELMQNIERVTSHLKAKIKSAGGDELRESLTLVPTNEGHSFLVDDDGNYWRTYLFIEGAKTYDVVENLDHVENAAAAFGRFQKRLSDLPGQRLNEIIPNFHNTKWRFDNFTAALQKDAKNRAVKNKGEIDSYLARGDMASVLINKLAAGELSERITHNDTKFNNVMIDDVTGKGICVIDLDTVMPGLALYDFGDSVRIGASTAAEDETDLSKVSMSLDMFERLTKGYLREVRNFLTRAEIKLLAFSARLITYEIGLRFITDYLEGDVYFKIHREHYNLDRARTQIAMVVDMEGKTEQMETIVEKQIGK